MIFREQAMAFPRSVTLRAKARPAPGSMPAAVKRPGTSERQVEYAEALTEDSPRLLAAHGSLNLAR